jgi:signal transduction histidine kinase
VSDASAREVLERGWARLVNSGRGTPPRQWPVRHGMVVAAVALYLPVLAIVAVLNGVPVDLTSTYVLVIVLLGVLSASPRIARPVRATLAAGAALTANVALIETSGRPAIAHLMFAFVLVLVTLYQSWALQAFATAYVALYYLVLSKVAPGLVLGVGMVADPSAYWPPILFTSAVLASLPAIAVWAVNDRAVKSTEVLQVALAEAALRERQAAELNDTVMQDLVTALYATEYGARDTALEATRRAVESARHIVDSLLTGTPGAVQPDLDRVVNLIRDAPAQDDSVKEDS